jgi:hypothetical protein
MIAPRRGGLLSFLPLLLAFLALAGPGMAQTLKVNNPGTGSIPLDGNWKFHLGDDQTWADPALDDAAWEPIRADSPWGAQSHPGYTGFAWYRQHIEVDNLNSAGTGKLALLIPIVQDTYDLFWNGQKLGTYGSLPPHANWWVFGHAEVYPLPSTRGVLAVRVWKAPLSSVDSADGGGFTSAPLLGDASVLSARTKLTAYSSDQRRLPIFLISAVTLVIGLLSFLLYLRNRKDGLYLWLALYLVASGLIGLHNLSTFRLGVTFRTYQLQTQLLSSAVDVSMWLILLSLFGLTSEPRWRRVTRWLVLIYLSAQLVDIVTIFFWDKGGVLPWIDGITTAVYSITPLYVFVIAAFGLMRRNRLTLWPLMWWSASMVFSTAF